MTSSVTQLPLRLNPQQVFNFDNFYFNQVELKQALADLYHPQGVEFIYLWGNKSAGKTHLLLAITEHEALRTLYLPLADLVKSASPAVLESLEALDLLCIDDLEAIAELPEWQEALFHCFNRLHHTACKLVVSALHNPAESPIALADLRSRMATALIYQLDELKDEDKQQALILQAQSRGLELSTDVAHYLLRHYSRDMNQLMSLLLDLDKASMSAQRRLTIPFVRPFIHG